MRENQERRRARRQPRGLRRVDEILDAAAHVFAEVGYDAVSTHMIAVRAGISHGSLYQFFPNKEAIAHALATRYVTHLRTQYETSFAPYGAHVPLAVFLDLWIDPLVAFTIDPGFLVLFAGSYTSHRLTGVKSNLHEEVSKRIEQEIAVLAPDTPLERQKQIATVCTQIAKALLPLVATDKDGIVGDLKAVMYRYVEPLVASNKGK
ncbi:MAG TPA: TetR/AcrR family transcriptional regulator [Ktedonobacteraceae bacterium]